MNDDENLGIAYHQKACKFTSKKAKKLKKKNDQWQLLAICIRITC